MTIRHLVSTTLKAQLVVYGAVAVLVAAAVTTLVNFRVAEAEARREVQAHTPQAATALRTAVEAVGPKEAQAILTAFDHASGTQAQHHVWMVSPEGRVVAGTSPLDLGKSTTALTGQPDAEFQQGLAGTQSHALGEITYQGTWLLQVTLPLYGDPTDASRITGLLHYAVAYRPLAWRLLSAFALSALLLALLLIAPLWLFLERSLLRPLRALTAANEAVAEGQSEGRMIPAEAMPAHELGRAMRSRNAMLSRLEATQRELRRRVVELAVLNQVAETVSRSLNLEETLPEVLDHMLALTKAEAADVRVVQNDELCLRVSRGLSERFLEQDSQVPIGHCLCGAAAQDGQLRVADNLQAEYPECVPCLAEGFYSNLSVPITAKGQVVGVMHLASSQPRAFNARHKAILKAVSQHVGLAIEKAQLYESERSQRQLAETLRQMSQTLSASLNLDKVLHALLEQLGQVLVVDAGLILLRENDFLRVAAVRGRPDLKMNRLLGYRLSVTANRDFWRVIQEKHVLTFCRPDRRPPFADGFRSIEDVDWCLVVPLMRGDNVIGLLALEQLDHCYDETEEPQIAMAFANHAVVALENARLYAEIKALNADLEARVEQRTHELNQAQEVLARQADQLRHLLNTTIRIQEEERGRIAQDIHDGVSQLIMGALYEIQAARVSLPERPEVTREKLQNAQAILKQVKTEMRRIIYDLHPAVISVSGLVPALDVYVGDYQAHTGIRCTLVTSPSVWRLAPEREWAVYRIVQEALHNVAQHAHANQARVMLTFTPDGLNVTVEDNGRGFDRQVVLNDSQYHLGMVSMQERAQSVGGKLEIHSQPGSGTRVTVWVPIDGRVRGDGDGTDSGPDR
jgi:signal transduction histidine kinase